MLWPTSGFTVTNHKSELSGDCLLSWRWSFRNLICNRRWEWSLTIYKNKQIGNYNIWIHLLHYCEYYIPHIKLSKLMKSYFIQKLQDACALSYNASTIQYTKIFVEYKVWQKAIHPSFPVPKSLSWKSRLKS